MTRPWAIVRAVPTSFVGALAAEPPDPPLDAARASAQQTAYAAALAGLGVELVSLEADEACPDCCFVEDIAVVVADAALVTRPGAPSRRAEVTAVAAALAGRLELHRMEPPATLDGGDCMRVGRTIFVGRSERTNAAGIDRLAEVAGPRGLTVVPVDMPPGVLHLKTVCSPLSGERVLLAPDTIPPATFAPARVLLVPPTEAHAANVVTIDEHALVAADAPATAALLAAAGLRPVAVDTSELRRADAALTCLSIVVD